MRQISVSESEIEKQIDGGSGSTFRGQVTRLEIDFRKTLSQTRSVIYMGLDLEKSDLNHTHREIKRSDASVQALLTTK